MKKKLGIIVPYRDRAEHLDQFVLHVCGYFARDKVDRHIDYQVIIVEQSIGKLFNRGMLKNIGFLMCESDTNYMCFHDIDYLPIWTDYSWVDRPTPIAWYGAEYQPIDPFKDKSGYVAHDLDVYFGGVVLVPNNDFRRVNGYANDYWGWGCEDTDLRYRFKTAGVELGRRKGTFKPLEHVNEGYHIDGTPSPIAIVNRNLLESRWKYRTDTSRTGLDDLSFDVLDERDIEDPVGERIAPWKCVTVQLNGEPHPSQEAALQ